MTGWTEGAYGTQIFTHGGWEVRINTPQWVNRIEVSSPWRACEVEVYPEGVWVKGEDSSGWHSSAEAFIIPWEVIAAIVEARKIVGAA